MRREVPGTGLPVGIYTAILLLSVLLFLFWGCPVWAAPRQASHVMRFVVSYFAVIPVTALALWLLSKFSVTHLYATVGTIWSIKLIITAVLYQFVATGGNSNYQPAEAPVVSNRYLPKQSYQAAAGPFASGALHGSVTGIDGDAIVWIESPAPGLKTPAPQPVALAISASVYSEPLALLHLGDTLMVMNRDPSLHTLHLTRGSAGIENRPLLGLAQASLAIHEPGLYHLRCDSHLDESSWLLVVDHPYAVKVHKGSYRFEQLPAATAATIHLVALDHGREVELQFPFQLQPGRDQEINLVVPNNVSAHPTREVDNSR